MSTVRPGSVRAWLLAARLPTLTAAVVPVAVGWACARRTGEAAWAPTIAALVGAIFIQIGTNLANDLHDFQRGADTAARLGPRRAAQSGLLTESALARGIVVAFGLAVVAGVYLTWVRGGVMVGIGVSSLLAGLAYTAGPFPLAYHGLGEVFVLVFFGFVAVCGTALAATGAVPLIAWLAAVPVGAAASLLLVVNNLRDRHTDAAAGKWTLVARFGRRFGEIEWVLLATLLYLPPVVAVASGRLGVAALLPLVTMPLAWRLWGEVRALDGAALNGVLQRTARLLLLHGLAWAVGLAAS